VWAFTLLTLPVAFCYLLGVSTSVTPILLPWVNVVMKDNAEASAVTVGAMVSDPIPLRVKHIRLIRLQVTCGWAAFSCYAIVVFPVIEGTKILSPRSFTTS